MLSTRRYILLSFSVFLLTLIALLPASLVLSKIEKQVPLLELEKVSGTLWNGYASLGYEKQSANISWDLNALKLLLLNLSLDLQLASEYGDMSAIIEIGPTAFEVKNLDGRLMANGLNNAFSQSGLGIGIKSNVTVSDLNIIRGRERFELAQGKMHWQGGAVSASDFPGGKVTLPPLEGTVNLVESGVSILITEKGKVEGLVDVLITHQGEAQLKVLERIADFVDIPDRLKTGDPESVMLEMQQTLFDLTPETDNEITTELQD